LSNSTGSAATAAVLKARRFPCESSTRGDHMPLGFGNRDDDCI
jgi:hypothetical protein